MALDATVGGASANSYLTRARAVTLAGDLLYVDAFTGASTADQDKALVMATQRINAVTCWTGAPASAAQALPFPRTGMFDRNGNALADDAIPLDLEQATLRMAVKLLGSEVTADNDAAVQGISRVKAGSVEVEFKDAITPFQDHPVDRWNYESVLPSDVLALLPVSWLCPKQAQRWFEAL